MIKGINSKIYKYAGILIFLIIWFSITLLNRQIQTYVANPIETFTALYSLFKTKQIVLDILATLTRTVFAFIPAVILGIISGILLGYYKKLKYVFEPIIEFFRTLPSTALLPVFILFFGINDFSRIGTAFFISYMLVLINTLYGVTNISSTRLNAALCMKANKYQLFTEVIIWEILPYIFSAMRLAISITLIVILISEMLISSKYGLGVRLFEMQQTYKTDYLYAIIFITGFLGYALNKIIILIQNRILHWTN